MLNVRAQISLLVGVSFLVTACGGAAGGKKTAIRKGKNSKAVSEWIKNAVYEEKETVAPPPVPPSSAAPANPPPNRGNQRGPVRPQTPTTPPPKGSGAGFTKHTILSCLSIPMLAQNIAATYTGFSEDDKRELISISAFDLDFVNPSDMATRRKNGITRKTFASEGEALPLQMQKANFFFVVQKAINLSGMFTASEILNSDLGKDLINVYSQDRCSTVTLNEGRGRVTYDIVDRDNRRLVLQRQGAATDRGEFRIYQLDGTAQVRISIVREEVGIPVCGAANQSTHWVKYDYLLSRSRDLEKMPISKNLAVLLNTFVVSDVPEVTQQMSSTPVAEKGKKGNGVRRNLMLDRVLISGSTYEFFLRQIRDGKAAKDLTCSPPTR